ncbi:hypothetical protein [Micromonospora thermarum]|uniref:Uncharacterized protein n=1 Tax=Micromonospora thermarum TaxID=2720024 RepID=A0ABX0ZCT2_9ACTN|nr:hypothetical protein [Micromonospora thermarum]NJP35725.1 hypothetical protein [Micromonospora thermarum]
MTSRDLLPRILTLVTTLSLLILLGASPAAATCSVVYRLGASGDDCGGGAPVVGAFLVGGTAGTVAIALSILSYVRGTMSPTEFTSVLTAIATMPRRRIGWHKDLTAKLNMSIEQATYQEQISKRPADQTYYLNDRSFDSYEPGPGGEPGTLVEAKHLGDDGRFARAYESMTANEFKDFAHLIDRAEKLLEQARGQVKAAEGTGLRIEWRISGEKATEAVKVLFANDPVLQGKITVRHVPLASPTAT